ncbi:MAG: VWA domain-containing protein [Proteobacteria bacterium]|nr:VWA domain-containing protein [Pseudomonadota bacterium]
MTTHTRLAPALLSIPVLLMCLGSSACEDAGGDFGADEDVDGITEVRTDAAPIVLASHSLKEAVARAASGDIPEARKITPGTDPGQGALQVVRGTDVFELPLVYTEVDAEIAGFVADIEVRQVYGNPFDEPIEATYLFPLPDDGAVDDLEMQIGNRIIVGEIHRRDEARKIYEEARDAGQTAALLEQERPNMFTQSVANILPGEAIEVVIHVVQPLKYEAGGYEWAFPTVVGPRFIPLQGTGTSGGAADDVEQLTGPVSAERTGNDIHIQVSVDAGVPLQGIRSPSHDIEIHEDGDGRADVALAPHETIPNKDFILRYEVAGEAPEAAVLTHRTGDEGYFILMIQPQADEFVTDDVVTPKEMVFVVDTSCSMSGYPLDKAKEAMELAITEMNPDDRFYVMDFNSTVSSLAPRPLENTEANRRRGLQYVRNFTGEGGTNMVEGIKASLDLPKDPELLRTVLFMTDGYIGNESEILAAVETRLDRSRLYSFGVGSSVNRYLLDRMAKVGRGHVEYVRQDEDADEHVAAFYERIRNPLLTDVEIEYDGIEVLDVYPDPVPDLFAGQPVILVGRYTQAGEGVVRVRGKIRGREHVQEIKVTLPEVNERNEGLASLWARTVVEDLEARMYDRENEAIIEDITEICLEHRLMSKYTSFVAVEEQIVNEDGTPKRVRVPLETPEGVDHGAIFGEDEKEMDVMMGGSVRRSGGSSSSSSYGVGGLGTRGSGMGGGGYGRGAGMGAPKTGKKVKRQAPASPRPSVSAHPSPSPGLLGGLADPAPEDDAEAVSEDIPMPVISGRILGDTSRFDHRLSADVQRRVDALVAELASFPGATGKLTLKIDVTRDGKVSRVTVLNDALANPEMLASIQKRMRSWWVAAPTDGKAGSFELEIQIN